MENLQIVSFDHNDDWATASVQTVPGDGNRVTLVIDSSHGRYEHVFANTGTASGAEFLAGVTDDYLAGKLFLGTLPSFQPARTRSLLGEQLAARYKAGEASQAQLEAASRELDALLAGPETFTAALRQFAHDDNCVNMREALGRDFDFGGLYWASHAEQKAYRYMTDIWAPLRVKLQQLARQTSTA